MDGKQVTGMQAEGRTDHAGQPGVAAAAELLAQRPGTGQARRN